MKKHLLVMLKGLGVFPIISLLFLALLISGSISIFSPSVFGAPYTEAYIMGNADCASYNYSDPSSGLTNPHTVSASVFMDGVASNWIAYSEATASTLFGSNSVLGDAKYTYSKDQFGEQQVIGSANVSYSIKWTSLESSQSDDVVNFSVSSTGNNSINTLLTGNLPFTYGTPYELTSVLSVNAFTTDAFSEAKSTWEDIITFYGKPDGTVGNATFTVSLNGSFLEEITTFDSPGFWPGLWGSINYKADFSEGASLNDIFMPDGSWFATASGTQYPVPEPSTLLLLGSGLAGLVGYGRRRLGN